MELKDVIAGQYYAAHYPKDENPTIILPNEDETLKGAGVRPSSNDLNNALFINSNNWSCRNNIRLATPEEIHWLDCCIAKDDLVSYEEAMGSFAKEEPITYSNEPDPELGKILTKLLNL